MSGSRFIGYVVVRPHVLGGATAFLLLNFTRNTNAALCFSVETATVFENEAEAKKYAEENKQLCSDMFLPPEVLPVWELTTRTLADPNAACEPEQLRDPVQPARMR